MVIYCNNWIQIRIQIILLGFGVLRLAQQKEREGAGTPGRFFAHCRQRAGRIQDKRRRRSPSRRRRGRKSKAGESPREGKALRNRGKEMNLRPAEPSAGGSGRVVNEPTSSEPATKAVFGTAVAMLKRDKRKKIPPKDARSSNACSAKRGSLNCAEENRRSELRAAFVFKRRAAGVRGPKQGLRSLRQWRFS